MSWNAPAPVFRWISMAHDRPYLRRAARPRLTTVNRGRGSASGRLDGVVDGLHAAHAVLEDERVDGVLRLAAASGRRPLQVEHVVCEHRLELPGRRREIAEQLGEDLPDAVLAAVDLLVHDEDRVLGVV